MFSSFFSLYVYYNTYELFCLFCFSFLISCILFLVSFFLVFQRRDSEKNTAYECGFQPFCDAFINFEVKYYILAVLFLIFDVELLFLYPYVFCLREVGLFGFYLLFFLCILFFIGYFIEIFFGVLK